MSVIQVLWDPPAAAHSHSTSGSHRHIPIRPHHFHFPPTGLHTATASFQKHLRAAGRKLSHAADGERGLAGHGSISTWVPNTDIRQTRLGYHIEIEVPGTTNKDDLLIQWLSPSTLIVRGNIERPLVGHGKAAEGVSLWQQSEERGDGYPVGNPVTAAQDSTTKESEDGPKTADDGGPLKRMDKEDESADMPLFLLEERRTGPWQRTFTLPHNVEMKALKAKLDGGLLRIEIPIQDANEKPGIKIDIE